MRQIKRWSLVFGASVLSSLLFSTTLAWADVPQSLTLSPSAVNVVIKPGAVNKGRLELINGGTISCLVNLYVTPYSVKGENYTPDFSPLPSVPNITNWLSFSSKQVSIPPGQALNVNYTLDVPNGTSPGGYYGVAFAEEHLPKVSQGVTISQQVGAIFYITVAGPAKETGKIVTWDSGFLQQSPLTAVLKLEDSGSVHYFSNIKINVSDIFGGNKYTFSSQKVLLPQTIRKINVGWNGSPAIGLFKVSGTATIFNQTKTLPTKYVLVLSKTARIYLVAIICLIIVLMIFRQTFVYLKRKSKKLPK